eukprot:gene23749-28474_t
MPLRALFDHPTVSGIAATIERAAQTPDADGIQVVARPAVLPLAPAQQRLWFLNRVAPESGAYNIPLAVSLRGAVDPDALSAAIVDVVTRHESLRTVFPQIGDNATQKVLGLGEGIAGLESIDVERGSLERVIFEFSSAGFDLVRERPVRYLLITVAAEKEGDDEEAVLVVVLHHMVADGWSLAPLAADLTGAYAARVGGNSPQWAPLPVQYADYTLWHREHLGDASSTDSLAHSQIAFWKQQLAGAPEQLHLPTDRPRALDPTMRGAGVDIRIGASTHQKLVVLAADPDVTGALGVSANDLFQIALSVEPMAGAEFSLGGLTITAVEGVEATAKFDLQLTLTTDPQTQGMVGHLVYAADLFDQHTVDGYAQRFVRAIEQVVADPSRPIGDVELLSDAERAELLVSVSASDSTALRGSNQLVPQRLAAAVEDDPEAVAVVVDGVDFTYQDVDARSSRLARHLINCGLGSGDQVSISGLTGLDLVVAVWAVFKSGAGVATGARDDNPVDLRNTEVAAEVASQSARPVGYSDRVRLLTPESPALVVDDTSRSDVNHGEFADSLRAMANEHDVDYDARLMYIGPDDDETSIRTILLAGSVGAAVVMTSEEVRVPNLHGVLEEDWITHVIAPPELAAEVDAEALPDLKLTCSPGKWSLN